jgi:transcription antitermination factor NusG
MRVETTKKWHAIYTRSKWEKKVADSLAKKKVEVYLPSNRNINRQWADKKRASADPLFKSLVFVNVTDNQMAEIKKTEGVINFVYWLSSPAVIKTEEIDTIRKFLIEYEQVSIEKTEVRPEDKVRIINGPLMMWEGNIVEIKTNTVKLTLPSFGYSLIAEIQKDNRDKVRTMHELKTRAI